MIHTKPYQLCGCGVVGDTVQYQKTIERLENMNSAYEADLQRLIMATDVCGPYVGLCHQMICSLMVYTQVLQENLRTSTDEVTEYREQIEAPNPDVMLRVEAEAESKRRDTIFRTRMKELEMVAKRHEADLRKRYDVMERQYSRSSHAQEIVINGLKGRECDLQTDVRSIKAKNKVTSTVPTAYHLYIWHSQALINSYWVKVYSIYIYVHNWLY